MPICHTHDDIDKQAGEKGISLWACAIFSLQAGAKLATAASLLLLLFLETAIAMDSNSKSDRSGSESNRQK